MEFNILYVGKVNRDEVASYCCKRRDIYLDLTNEQWMLAEELLKILKPFEVATTVLCEVYLTYIVLFNQTLGASRRVCIMFSNI